MTGLIVTIMLGLFLAYWLNALRLITKEKARREARGQRREREAAEQRCRDERWEKLREPTLWGDTWELSLRQYLCLSYRVIGKGEAKRNARYQWAVAQCRALWDRNRDRIQYYDCDPRG